MKGRQIHYSADELNWIPAFADMPRRELHALFVQVWNRADVSFENFKALCTRKGWKTGRTGCFSKGQPAYNKGQRMPEHPNSVATRFKPGAAPPNRLPMWSERIGKDGYIEIKVPEVNPWTGHKTRFRHKHRYLWEQANGPIPKGYALKCLDGDKLNTDPANWTLIPRAMLPRLNGKFGRDFDTAPPELRPLILAATKLEHAAREARKGANHG